MTASSSFQALQAVVDGLLPPTTTNSRSRLLKSYHEQRLSTNPLFLAALDAAVSRLKASDRQLLQVVLQMLCHSIGTSLLFGQFCSQAFVDLPMESQTALLQSLQHSRLASRRRAFVSLKRLICGVAYSFESDGSASSSPQSSITSRAMGYPGALLAADDAKRTQAASEHLQSVQEAVLDTTTSPTSDLDCDILIVGSGAGGCVAASILSRAGYRVLVVDKGPYLPPSLVRHEERYAYDQLYEQGATLTTTDGAILVLAGSNVGGGTTINWSCCLPLPDFVRQEWCEQYGLDAFVDAEYDKALNYVLIKIGALTTTNTNTKQITHNAMNVKLQQACAALGYAYETTAQNLQTTADPMVGYTCFGDRYGLKLSGVSVFLKDAVKHGAKIVDQCQVTRVLTSTTQSQSSAFGPSRPTATGAVCRTKDGTSFTIHARKAVVVAAGALHTPCLLQRSGLKNPHIGKHLRLHPVTAVMGYMPNEKMDCFLGAPMTTVCNEFARGPKGDGYGARIECPSAHPGLLAAATTWTTPFEFRERMQQLRNNAIYIILQRDTGEGSVKLARDGVSPLISYNLNAADKKSMATAVTGGLEVLITGGAQKVASSHIRDPSLIINEGPFSVLQMASNERIQNYLSYVSKQGMRPHEVGLFSAHQMGSCRMSAHPAHGAVDVNGESWEVDNLFVMDASTFPTASGVNPMVTVFVIAKMFSSRLALRLRYEDNRPTGMSEQVRAKEFIDKRVELRKKRGPLVTKSLILHVILWAAVILFFAPMLFGGLVQRRVDFSPPPVVKPPSPPPRKPSPPPAPRKPMFRGRSEKPAPAPTLMKPFSETISGWWDWFTEWDDEKATNVLPTSLMWTLIFMPFLAGVRGPE